MVEAAGGRFLIHDVHPVAWALADDSLAIEHTYFEEAEPFTEDSPDTYTDAELTSSIKVESLQPGWVQLVRAARPAYALLDPGSSLADAIEHEEGWSVVRYDARLELLSTPPGWTH